MVRVCAWCRQFLGLKRPVERWVMTHGICPRCRTSVEINVDPTPGTPSRMLVILSDPLRLEAAGQLIARAGYPLAVLPDRRRSDRRRRHIPVSVERRRGDRRGPPPPTWVDGYVLVEPALDPEIAALAVY